MAPAGTPDIVGYLRTSGSFVGIEVKRPGEKPTSVQVAAGRAIVAAGGVWLVVTSAQEAVDGISRAGKFARA